MEQKSENVVDLGAQDFQEVVLNESHNRPVVVDFWAPWCGPCMALGPTLESLADEGKGSWLLVKINVDDHQEVAMRYSVQGIPAVKAFKDGELCDEFVGAMPEQQIQMWLDGFVEGPADERVQAALKHLEEKKYAEARVAAEQALELKPRHPRATLALAKIDFAEGAVDAAKKHLQSLVHLEDERLFQDIAAFKLEMQSMGDDELSSLRKQVEASPDDLKARLSLGKALSTKDHEEALQTLLYVIEKSPSTSDDLAQAARASILEIFDVLGMRHELSTKYRSLLAQQLYR